MLARLVAIPLIAMLGAWSPAAPSQGGGSATSVQQMQDHNWTPPSYSLQTTPPPGGSNTYAVDPMTTVITPTTPQCVPARGQRLAQGTCERGQMPVSYANTCGGTITAYEPCATGEWTFFWIGSGQCQWVCQASVYKQVCVKKGTQEKLASEECGAMTRPEGCYVGYSPWAEEQGFKTCSSDWELKMAVGGPIAVFGQ